MIHLSQEVLDLVKEKDAQAVEILGLKKRVKRLERQRKSSTSQPRRRKYRHVESLVDDLNEEDASKHGMSSDKTKPMCLAWMSLLDLCEVYLPGPVMAISVISVSSDSSEESVGTSTGRVILFWQPIPYGRPYRYHLNGLVRMITARKRVGPLPTHRLAVRHSVDYSSSDHFSSDDSLRDSSSSSSSESSSDSSADALSDSASSLFIVHRTAAISDRPSHDSSSASPSRKRSRSPAASVPLSSPIPGALSSTRADLLPSPKRIRSPKTATDVKGCSEDSFEPYVPREAGLRVDFEDESSESSRSRGTDLEMDIEMLFRAEGLMLEFVVEALLIEIEGVREAQKELYTGGLHMGAVSLQVAWGVGGSGAQDREATGHQSADMLERIKELERDNMRLRDMMDVTRQCLTPDLEHQGYEEVNGNGENRNGRNRNGENGNGGDGNEGNGNGNGNGGGNGYNFKGFVPAQETIGIEAAYAMSWAELMKLTTKVYCPKNEGNVIAAEPTKLQDAIRIANNLMDQKLKGYARRGGANPDSNVVLGTFLLNNCHASMLFDLGADRIFVSSTFSALLDVAPSTLDTSYAVELVDGRILETNVVLIGYTLELLGHQFDIDLMPVELRSFDVIISMDWLAKYHTLIVCDKKVIRIPYEDEVLIIRGDDCDDRSVQTVLDRFVIVFIDDILIYSKSKKEHEGHLKLIIGYLIRELSPKFLKCELLSKVQLLGLGIHVDHAKIKAIKDWESPKTPIEICQFLGLASYYRRFIEGFSKIARPMMKLTQKSVKFDWGERAEAAF
ncbi:putative reverse transcriptase domain-containing protein [Tanacetum coccineum]